MAENSKHEKSKVKIFEKQEDLSLSLANYIAHLSKKFICERGCFTVVLSGGDLFESLTKLVVPPYVDSIDWAKWHIFWLDERVVKKTDPDSNYLLAYNELLSKVPIPADQIYAIDDTLSPEDAAKEYEARLKKLVLLRVVDLSTASGFPKFDLILMGMGPDGHVASLFPGRPQVNEKKKWVTFILDSPKPPPPRITFTFPVINSAAHIALIIRGTPQADAVNTALGKEKNTTKPLLPVQMVSPEGELTWFLDKDAASKLQEKH